MAVSDWYTRSLEIVKAVGAIAWKGITWPVRAASGLPDWVKGIIFGLLIILAAFLAWQLYKSYRRREWDFIDI